MSATGTPEAPSPAELRAAFEGATPYTVGIEEEVMLLDPETLALAHRASEVLERLDGDDRFKPELPASQIEIVTPPSDRVSNLGDALIRARRDLAARTNGLVRLGSAGVHPFSPGDGELNRLPQYEQTIREYGAIAARQLVCAFQVHVSVGSADRALAIYNGARSYLPLLAALAANAPFYEGHDTGHASIRPQLGGLLPRQGVPPEIGSWDAYAEALAWGEASGSFISARWWWELRPHHRWGTLEFRVPDGQMTVADGIALAAVIQALVEWLGERHQAGEALPVARRWRIEENRWSASRYGVEGTMVDLESPIRRPTRELLAGLLATLEPLAARRDSEAAFVRARALVEANGAIDQRRAGDAPAAARLLAERFLDPWPG